MRATETCEGCGGTFLHENGPTHPYMRAAPACWRTYGNALALEYSDLSQFAAANRFTVDGYALQHPGLLDDRRANQSVWLHYASLRLIFEFGRSYSYALSVMKTLSNMTLPPRPPGPSHFSMTIVDFAGVDPSARIVQARKFANCAYESWSDLAGDADRMIARL